MQSTIHSHFGSRLDRDGSRKLKHDTSQQNSITPCRITGGNSWNNMQSWDKSDDKWARSSWGWWKWKSQAHRAREQRLTPQAHRAREQRLTRTEKWGKPWSPCDWYEKTPSTTRKGKVSASLPTNVWQVTTESKILSEETDDNEDAGMLSRGTGGSDAQLNSIQLHLRIWCKLSSVRKGHGEIRSPTSPPPKMISSK